jgi:hypothetical protein
MPAQTKIQMRQGTATEWTTANPILANGENGYETDTKKFKIGDGTSTWSALDYFTSSSNTLTQFGSTTTTRTNLVANPSFEVDLGGWAVSSSTATRVTTDYKFGTASAQVVYTASGQTFYLAVRPAVIGSTTYTASIWVKAELGKSFNMEFREYDAAQTSLINTAVAVTGTGVWQRVSTTVMTQATTVSVQYIIRNQYSGAHTLYVDGVLLETGSLLQPYFDGATTSSRNVAYAWTGTANYSTSTETRTIGTGASADFIYTNSVQSNTQQLLVNGVDYDLMRLQGQNQDRTFIETMPRGYVNTTSATLTQQVAFTVFTPQTTLTVSQITMAMGATAASTDSKARMGLYTFDGYTATLVARTAEDSSLLFRTANLLYTRSFDTTGGYPASYTLQAGQRYAFAFIVTATTTAPLVCQNATNSLLTLAQPIMAFTTLGTTDLPTTATAAPALRNTYWARFN